MSKDKKTNDAGKKAALKAKMDRVIESHVGLMEYQSRYLSELVSEAEELLTESERSNSNEYAAIALMVDGFADIAARVAMTMNKPTK